MRLAPAVFVPALAGSLLPALAAASPGDAPSSVIGGTDAKAGKWPDVAALFAPGPEGDEFACGGTLVAPTVVLTAGHCFDPFLPLPDKVLIGTATLARPGDGETIAIKRATVFPDPELTEDIAVVVLARASSRTPRKIVDGWARFDMVNGAVVSLVGFGAIDRDGEQFVDELQEASSTITDVDCTTSVGCNPPARPAGELGAGGMGVDTCTGDSGGPLYLMTSYGPVLAGVTARSYDNPEFVCSDGGIYVRPDKLLDWIEANAGVSVARAGSPSADPLSAVHGDGDDVRIQVNDPASNAHSFEITAPPAHGMVKVRGDGAIRVCVDPDAPVGDDQVTVMITDTKNASRALPLTIPIHIQDGTPPAKSCDINAFSETGGCSTTGPGSAIPVVLGVLALLRRRRRS